MIPPPATPRAIVFVDGQNLFYAVKNAFGYRYPNYDIKSLAERLCSDQGWKLVQTRFYTGVPDQSDDPFWHQFWTNKLGQMGRRGIVVFSRALRYHNQTVRLTDGTEHTALVRQEKGVDVRLALDVVSLASGKQYDVALILSQDQDLTEAVKDVKWVAKTQNRWLWTACAYPCSPTTRKKRGVDGTQWIKMDRILYDSCIDKRDYRQKPQN